jgi:hypothetical protein
MFRAGASIPTHATAHPCPNPRSTPVSAYQRAGGTASQVTQKGTDPASPRACFTRSTADHDATGASHARNLHSDRQGSRRATQVAVLTSGTGVTLFADVPRTR